MESQLIQTVELENGLTLEIRDASRKVATDRWLVKVVASMEVEVSDRWFSGAMAKACDPARMRAKLGDTLRFEYVTERNFVDQSEKQAILEALLASVLAKKAYYSHPDFAARFLIKSYADRRYLPDPA